jgi:hypothetical protein
MKYVVPSLKETAFNCPHCGALAKQFWSRLYLSPQSVENPLIHIPTLSEHLNDSYEDIDDLDVRAAVVSWAEKIVVGAPFIETEQKSRYLYDQLHNCNVSRCFNCSDVSIWIHHKMVFPVVGSVMPANADMPDDIKRDYEEAGAILNQSPRGAAALIRLAIQKLCKELGQPGKNINDDIKALVAGGLDVRVQQALDAVRVIGNSAVHPGKIDIRDDRSIAETLFRLLNLIVDKTISEPKHVKEVYESLPENLLAEIARRDAPKS